jgi:uncharacterized DUF497 family protein
MTNTEKDKLLDKIKKILAKAGNNPNEHEAAMAAEMAQEMLARHNLTMADVAAAEDKAEEIVQSDDPVTTTAHPWRRPLATAVATMYFCKYVFYSQGGKNRHIFVGTRANVAVAEMMFVYLITAVERLAQQGARSVPEKERSPYRTSFRAACSKRLCWRIAELITEAKRGKQTSSGTNLPACLDLYKKHETANEEWANNKWKSMRQVSAKLRTDLHYKGNTDGDRAGHTIGLNQQVSRQGNTPAKALT